jgi:hypothetical protein
MAPYKGQLYVHFRFFDKYSSKNELYPTKDGVSLNNKAWLNFVKFFPEIRRDAEQIMNFLRKGGRQSNTGVQQPGERGSQTVR